MLRRLADVEDLRVSRIDLWWSDAFSRENLANSGFPEACAILAEAGERDPGSIALHDASGFGADACRRLYREQLMLTAVTWDYRLGNLFGSRGDPGAGAGRTVPALVVRLYAGDDVVALAAPHEQWTRQPGNRTSYELHTIRDTLGMLSRDDQKRFFGRFL